MTASHAPEDGRLAGLDVLKWIVAAFAILPVLGAWAAGAVVVIYAVAAGLLAVTAFLAAGRDSLASRLTVSFALVGQVMLLTASLSGHALQIDSHMLYFASLAMLLVLLDTRVLLATAGFVALQHLSLGILLPSLVYSSGDLTLNLMRTAVHGAVVIAEVSVLCYAILTRQRLDARLEEASTQLSDALLQAESKRERAEQAQHEQGVVVDELRNGLAALAEGDLTCRLEKPLPDAYEPLRSDFNAAVNRLSAAIVEVQDLVDCVNGDMQAIDGAAHHLAHRTEEQAAVLTELSDAFEAMSKEMTSATSEAETANARASETSDKAASGQEVLSAAISTMERIKSGSMEIQKITQMIEDLAVQTNLLALNAGVEAARAGSAGQGFAVVAAAVRELAQQSGSATASIRELIDRNEEDVRHGVSRVTETEMSLNAVLSAVTQAVDAISKISSVIARQAEQVQTLDRQVSGLATATQQNAAASEETSASTATVVEALSKLETVTGRFRTPSQRRSLPHAA